MANGCVVLSIKVSFDVQYKAWSGMKVALSSIEMGLSRVDEGEGCDSVVISSTNVVRQ